MQAGVLIPFPIKRAQVHHISLPIDQRLENHGHIFRRPSAVLVYKI